MKEDDAIECSSESDGSWRNIRAAGDERSSKFARRQQGLEKKKQRGVRTDTSEEHKKVASPSVVDMLMSIERRCTQGVASCIRIASSCRLSRAPGAASTCISYIADFLLKCLYALGLPRTAEALVSWTLLPTQESLNI